MVSFTLSADLNSGGDDVTTLQTLQIPVRGMTCAGCAGRVERGLLKVPGVEQAVINLVTSEAIVHLKQPVALKDLIEAVEASGYQVPVHGFDYAVSGMNCGSCVGRIEKALAQSPIVISYQVNLATKQPFAFGGSKLKSIGVK